MLLAAYFIFLFLVLALCFTFLWRSVRVYHYRMWVLDEIMIASDKDFARNHFDFKWRFETMDTVDFNDMMFPLWRRLDTYYPDKSFIEPTPEDKLKRE